MLDVGESGIKVNSAQFSWSLAELGNILKVYAERKLRNLPTTSVTDTMILVITGIEHSLTRWVG